MAIASKVKALLNLKGKDHAGLAAHFGISSQALSNKFYRDSFSAEDLIKVAEYVGVPLAFIVDENMQIVLDAEDLKHKKGGDK